MQSSRPTPTRWPLVLFLMVPAVGILLFTLQSPATPVRVPVPATSLTAFFNLPTSAPTPTALTAGETAPPFILEGLDGETHSLQSYRGKRVILNFWATWCAPCRLEMPLLQAAHTRLEKSGVIVVGVNQAEDVATIRKYVKELNLTFPVLLDSVQSVSQDYQVFGLPTTFFIDSQGRLQDENLGPLTEETLQGYLDKLVAKDK